MGIVGPLRLHLLLCLEITVILSLVTYRVTLPQVDSSLYTMLTLSAYCVFCQMMAVTPVTMAPVVVRLVVVVVAVGRVGIVVAVGLVDQPGREV